MPRLLGRDWPRPALINLHFLTAAVGVLIYAVALGIGGILQGLELTDPQSTFEASLKVTLPYLMIRSLGGTLMLLSHLILAFNIMELSLRKGAER